MKKFVILSALAVALAGVSTHEAAAHGGGFNIRMGVGLNLMFDWNAWCNPCQSGCGHGGHGGGGHLFGFPDGSYQYQGQHFTAPPPSKEGKAGEEATLQSYTYPKLGYSIHHPASYQGYGYQGYGYQGYGYQGYQQPYYYTPTLRFDQ